MKSLVIFGLLLLALTNPYRLCSQNQNDKNTVYDINDPRNPDCPCHKLQALAEKEYKQDQQRSSPVTSSAASSSYSSGGSSKSNGLKKIQRKVKRKIRKVYYRHKIGGRRMLYPLKQGILLVCR